MARTAPLQPGLILPAATDTVVPPPTTDGIVQSATAGGMLQPPLATEVTEPALKRQKIEAQLGSPLSTEAQVLADQMNAANARLSDTPKAQINQICARVAKRTLQKTDIVYNVIKVTGGHQATLQMPCFPPPYDTTLFTGYVCKDKKEAEQSVAGMAVQQLKSDPMLADQIEKKPETGKKKNGGFKSWFRPKI